MNTDEHDVRMEIADLKLRVAELERAARPAAGAGGGRDDWADRLVAAVQDANQAIATLAGEPGISEVVVSPRALADLGDRVPTSFLTATGIVRVVARVPEVPEPARWSPTTFPILRVGNRASEAAVLVSGVVVAGLPWRVVERWRARIELNHGQTMERIAERGGLTPWQLWCAAHDRNLHALRQVPVTEVRVWLGQLVIDALEGTP